MSADVKLMLANSRVEEARKVLARVDELFRVALPQFNWGASALSGEAIMLLNEVPGEVRKAREIIDKLPARASEEQRP